MRDYDPAFQNLQITQLVQNATYQQQPIAQIGHISSFIPSYNEQDGFNFINKNSLNRALENSNDRLQGDSSEDVDSLEKEELDIDEGSKNFEDDSIHTNSGMKNPLDFSNMLFTEQQALEQKRGKEPKITRL